VKKTFYFLVILSGSLLFASDAMEVDTACSAEDEAAEAAGEAFFKELKQKLFNFFPSAYDRRDPRFGAPAILKRTLYQPGYNYVEISRPGGFSVSRPENNKYYQAIRESQESLDDIDALRQYYKIHILVDPEHLLELLELLKKDSEENPDFYYKYVYEFKHDNEPGFVGFSSRKEFPSVVIYPALGYEAAQAVYDHMRNLLKDHQDWNSKPSLLHNLGGPVVWWTGGDSDDKPEGRLFNENILQYLEQDPSRFGSYPYFKGQRPLIYL